MKWLEVINTASIEMMKVHYSCIVEKKHLRLRKETGKTYKWKVVKDHIAANPPTKYEQAGVINFSMKDFSKQPNDPDYNYPFARLVEDLWPGEWREQLAKLNVIK